MWLPYNATLEKECFDSQLKIGLQYYLMRRLTLIKQFNLDFRENFRRKRVTTFPQVRIKLITPPLDVAVGNEFIAREPQFPGQFGASSSHRMKQ